MKINNNVKINLYDYVELKNDKYDRPIKSYIYDINEKLNTCLIYNDQLCKKEIIKINMITDVLNKCDEYYKNQIIEYYDDDQNKWLKGIYYDYNDNHYNIIPYDKSSNTEKIKDIKIQNIKKCNDNEYFKLNEIVIIKNNIDYKEITYNDIGRIIKIDFTNNKFEYEIKFQNSNMITLNKENLNKTTICEYFINDVVLYMDLDLEGIIYEGLIYNINNSNSCEKTYELIKIVNNKRYNLIKNIKITQILKFIKNFSYNKYDN